MNKNLLELEQEFIKHPYLTESDLEQMFNRIMRHTKTVKQGYKNYKTTPKDRRHCILLLKQHLEYILDND